MSLETRSGTIRFWCRVCDAPVASCDVVHDSLGDVDVIARCHGRTEKRHLGRAHLLSLDRDSDGSTTIAFFEPDPRLPSRYT